MDSQLILYVGFQPVITGDMETHYDIYSINTFSWDVVLDFEYLTAKDPLVSFSGIVNAETFKKIGTINRDHLNDAPNFTVGITPVTTEGNEATHDFSFKIKPSSFFKKGKLTPLLNSHTYLFEICRQSKWEAQKSGEDLSTYTRRMSRLAYKPDVAKSADVHNVERKALFSPEIDLHIEQLASNHKSLGKSDKLQIQLKAFDEFLEQAILLDEPRVFIIHGVGKGRLRNEIATRLIQNPDVVSFKNEYHPNYGFGATEVILK